MDWIESSEPPAVGEIVIVAMPGRKGALLGKYMGEGVWRVAYGSRISANVTHWMPRPEMPYAYKRSQTSWYERGKNRRRKSESH